MTPTRRFFVGIGAQRSGTTWLSLFLRNHPEVRFSPVKEVRFFDSKHVPEFQGVLRNRLNTRLAARGLARHALAHPVMGARLARHYLGIRRLEDEHYRAFFRLLARDGRLAGEISPSYAALGVDAIRRIEDLLDRPRYVYVLRNPVDRLLSETSFRASRLGKGRVDDEAARRDGLAERLAGSLHLDYAANVARYESVAGPARLHLMFMENLFEPGSQGAALDGLADFLGVRRLAGAPEGRVNASAPLDVPADLRRDLARALARQYRFAEARFGEGLPDAWRRDLDLLG